ncbi:DUF1761 domain-containing protein [Sphingorhabdus arenilitoris]|uniref:DUF1761 domain-containing protein n=1 Tax=Sphingorhabdus arenilitoris TaxID=1490041 RepID=A0ABV8RE64_9SPHN
MPLVINGIYEQVSHSLLQQIAGQAWDQQERDFMGNINLLAVFAAAVSAFMVGGLWYGPIFGKAWMKEHGFTEENLAKGNAVKIYGLTFAFSLLSAVMLGHLLARTGVSEAHIIMMMSVGIALGFIMPAIGSNYLFSHKSGRLFFIDAGYWITFYAVMGGVFILLGA